MRFGDFLGLPAGEKPPRIFAPAATETTLAALLGNGTIRLFDAETGAAGRIYRLDAAGKPAGAFGRKGGRARAGRFDSDGVREATGIAVDAEGRVWAAENQRSPRRISVWKPDGAFEREYFSAAGWDRKSSFLMLMRTGEGAWEPVAGITTVGYLRSALKDAPSAWANRDEKDSVLWNDFNNDGYVQPDECEIPEDGEGRSLAFNALGGIPTS